MLESYRVDFMSAQFKQRNLTITPLKEGLYEEEQEEAKERYLALMHLYLAGDISLDEFDELMRVDLRDYYIRIVLIAREGGELTEQDRRDIAGYLAIEYAFLDGFISDLRESRDDPDFVLSDQMALWRIGLYSLAWQVLSRFSLPRTVVPRLPVSPGIDCKGGSACGCRWEWEQFGNELHFYWIIDPLKENCELCLTWESMYNPYVIILDEDEVFLD